MTHGSGATPVSVNQQQGGGAWNLLGTFSLSPGMTHNIALTDQANGYVIADAIRLVPVNLVVEQKLYFIEVDHLNTPRAIENAQQQVVWKWEQSEPFGNSLPDGNPNGLGVFLFALRFPGQYGDAETGLTYNYFRDYDPSLARYVQSDPMGLESALNTYLYVDEDPLADSDFYGLIRGSMRGFRRVNCPAEERAECEEHCKSQGKVMESCKITRGRRLVVRNGVALPELYTVPGSMSCNCIECDNGVLKKFWDWLTTPKMKDDPLSYGGGMSRPTKPGGATAPGPLPGFAIP